LLGTYLAENGFGIFMYARGERKRIDTDGWCSHAWLEADGIIVDITADQFHDNDTPVIVALHSPWHETFEPDDETDHAADYRIFDERTVFNLGHAYDQIIAQVRKLQN